MLTRLLLPLSLFSASALAQGAHTPSSGGATAQGVQQTFMGYTSGVDTAQRFGERLFGLYHADQGRLDILAETESGYVGTDLFGRDFTLTTSVEKTAPLPSHDGTLTVWMGIAESSWSVEPVPVVAFIITSASLNQRRFVPIATLNSQEGLVWMSELRERTINLGPRLSMCAMPEPYLGRLEQGRMQYAQCSDEKMEDMWQQIGLCVLVTGPLCLFPPTAIFACPAMPVCVAAAGYCGISGHYRAGNRFDNFHDCLCESAVNGWDANGCSFECPSCSLPLLPGGGG
jgi:hypothetical protein